MEQKMEECMHKLSSVAVLDKLPPTCTSIPVSEGTNHPHRLVLSMQSEGMLTCVSIKERVKDTEPVAEDHIRFVCMSDTHSKMSRMRETIPEGDVLLHAGDFTYRSQPQEFEDFNNAISELPFKHRIVIAGNHETFLDPCRTHIGTLRDCCRMSQGKAAELERETPRGEAPDLRRLLTSATYLEDSYTILCGIKIFGSPWQPRYSDLGFNLDRGRELLEKWNGIPTDTDILITHGPPAGYGDVTRSNKHVGCIELLNTIKMRLRPAVCLFGHIHEGHGVYSDNRSLFINASICNKSYRPVHKPIVFDVKLPSGHTREELLEKLSIFTVSKH